VDRRNSSNARLVRPAWGVGVFYERGRWGFLMSEVLLQTLDAHLVRPACAPGPKRLVNTTCLLSFLLSTLELSDTKVYEP